jgi:hypothetical protein
MQPTVPSGHRTQPSAVTSTGGPAACRANRMPFLGDQHGVSPYAADLPGALAGLRRAAQTSLQRFEQNFSKSIAATLPHFGRPAQWTLSPPATSCCLEWTERGHFFETVGSCWTGQYKNFGALLLVRWGTYEKGSGSLTGCCDEVGSPVMQRVVEHRRTQNFARGCHGEEVGIAYMYRRSREPRRDLIYTISLNYLF